MQSFRQMFIKAYAKPPRPWQENGYERKVSRHCCCFSFKDGNEMRASGLISPTRSVAEWRANRAATGLWSRTRGRPTVCDLWFFFYILFTFFFLFRSLLFFFFCSLSWCETWRRRSSGKLMLRGIPASRLEHLLLGEDLAFKFSLSEVFLLMAKF